MYYNKGLKDKLSQSDVNFLPYRGSDQASSMKKRFLPAQQLLLFVISRGLLKGKGVQEGRDHLTVKLWKTVTCLPLDLLLIQFL